MDIRFLLFFFIILQVYSQDVDQCDQHKTCSDCVRAYHQSYLCKWCATDNHDIKTRCISTTKNITGCTKYENPESYIDIIEDRNFSSADPVTQIKPQHFKIVLRPAETKVFNFSFHAAENYPADLYFLFDASTTMINVLKTIADASEQIYKAMLKNTNNVQLGLGTFIDKNAAPFVREESPNVNSFRHRLSMTSNFTHFKELVSNVAEKYMGQNNDDPEGGFDALAQVMTCKKKLGWRDVSRKIIFFFTDNPSHAAGDAKSAGIVHPYDGECHTNEHGVYTKELDMDYPSFGIISELAAREEMTIIFITSQSVTVRDKYITLTQLIRGAKYHPFFEYNDKISLGPRSSIQQKLAKIYQDITQNIKLDVIRPAEVPIDDNLQISFTPDCYSNNSDCKVPVGGVKNFQAEITLSSSFRKPNTTVKVSIGGIIETITLDIEVTDCDCDIEYNSKYCSGYGTKKCGICECDSKKTGAQCECDTDDKNMDEREDRCKQNETDLICSGFGHCICGICHCNPGSNRIGPFCESRNYCHRNCYDHGKCYYGKCYCDENWTGEFCECNKNKRCKQVNGKECNGDDRGKCVCGSCQCKELAKWDARQSQNYETCEIYSCTHCHQEQCDKLRECAICRQNYEPSDCQEPCGNIVVVTTETISNTSSENGEICERMATKLGCYTRFQYRYDMSEYKIHLLVQTKSDCLESYYKLGGGILVALLLGGLLMLVAWKLLTNYQDRREYQQFLKMHSEDADVACQNPIYEAATTTFKNPSFRKNSVNYTLN